MAAPRISRREDRCLINSLAMENGLSRFATLVGPSAVANGWPAHLPAGGQAIDIVTGEFGRIDLAAGRYEPIAFRAGYARALTLHGDVAIIGISLPPDNRTFTGLALDQELARRGAEPRCAILVVDLRTGDTVHWLRFEGVVQELYDVAILPGVVRPAAIGFKSDEIRRIITIADPQPA